MTEFEPKGVPLSPLSMVDSVADWPLQQVIYHLKNKGTEGSSENELRIYSRSCIRFLDTIIDTMAEEYGVSRSWMSRCLSYHGTSIQRSDKVIQDLSTTYREARRLALERDSPDIADIINSLTPYSPGDTSTIRVGFSVYDSWVMSDVEETCRVCGVHAGQYLQVAMIRSILTCDSPSFTPVADRLVRESRRWRLWMDFRLSVLQVAVARWESLLEP